eukprot:CAMPEP_0170563742 /NCGR_PEP_ID=MMETSP0211-20121228/68645_1 /TAXON_ID=311385 /ORGANISM="Pseudokeronopsis sp., Strain OXSARD2" /LENGTH=73 /DNA_ID=CAMNT_0010882357 /DNA_START=1361 /DNA_END=1582 /DNA_ORIENTATION=-
MHRLGAGDYLGPRGTEVKNDFEELKQHPFFEGVNFATLRLQTSPVAEDNVMNSPQKAQLAKYLPSNKEAKMEE